MDAFLKERQISEGEAAYGVEELQKDIATSRSLRESGFLSR